MSYAFPTSGIHFEISGNGNDAPGARERSGLALRGRRGRPGGDHRGDDEGDERKSRRKRLLHDVKPFPSRFPVNETPDGSDREGRPARCCPLGERLAAQWDASVNSVNSPVTTNAVCSPMSTALSPIRSMQRATTIIRIPHSCWPGAAAIWST